VIVTYLRYKCALSLTLINGNADLHLNITAYKYLLKPKDFQCEHTNYISHEKPKTK